MRKLILLNLFALGIWLLPASLMSELSAYPQELEMPAAMVRLPDGEGKEQVLNTCAACHDLERVVSQRKTAEGWQATVMDMLQRVSPDPGEKADIISRYLAAHYGVETSTGLERLRSLLDEGNLAAAEAVVRENSEPLGRDLDQILSDMDQGFDELGRQKARYDVLLEKFFQFDATWMPNQEVFELYGKVLGKPEYPARFRAKRLRVEGARHTTSADHFWDQQQYARAFEEYGEAIAKLRAAITLAESAGDRKLVAACLTNIGYAEIYSGRPEEGLKNYTQAMEIAEQREDEIFQGMYALNLSTFYLYTLRPQEALGYAQQSAELTEKVRRRTWEANALLNVGSAYLSMGQAEEAHSYLQKALLKAEEAQDRRSHGRVLFNLALVNSRFDRLADAVDLMERALEWYNENEIVYGESEQTMVAYQGLHFLGSVSRKMGEEEKARGYAEKANQLRDRDPQRLAGYLDDPHLNFAKWDEFNARWRP